MKYELDYRQTRLANGLKVVTVSMPGRQSVSLGVWIRAGSRHEAPKTAGISHVLEHMLFKGTRRRSARRIKEEVEGNGGVLNAFTAEECTCYFAKIMKGRQGKAMDVLADMVKNAVVPPRELEKEKAVIIDEIKMIKDVPGEHIEDVMGEMLWPGHPLGRPISGSEESVGALKRGQILEYKARHYHPAGIVVSAAGPVSHAEVLEFAKRHFPAGNGKPAPQPVPADAAQKQPKAVFLGKKSEQTHFMIGMHGFSRYHPDRYKLALLSLVLGGNMSSRLFEELREKRGLAYDIRASAAFYEETGSFVIAAGVEPKKAWQALSQVMKELSKLRKTPVGRGELRRAKDYFMSQFYLSLEDTLEAMLWVGEASVYRDHVPSPEAICREIESVTADELRQTAAGLFQTPRLNLALIGPVTARDKARLRRALSLENG
ncbi:MAG TPA: pitrilysin family protein [Verrucomicrobiae bacterium]|jgi:predicted Zn-dependent peptidase|nr:pitrilysin family protein [Verrucomicrobiae bacterium]